MVDYTPEELKRGRFLWHFFGYRPRFVVEDDPTEEILAVPAGDEAKVLGRASAHSESYAPA